MRVFSLSSNWFSWSSLLSSSGSVIDSGSHLEKALIRVITMLDSGGVRTTVCWRSESFEMFYLRELLNSYSSLEIYARRPSLYPVRRPFLLKRVKKEALCPISLKEGRGWAQVGRYPAVFCKLGKKDGLGTYTLHHHCKRTWTWWIPDRCYAGLFVLFLHDLRQSNIMNVKNEW